MKLPKPLCALLLAVCCLLLPSASRAATHVWSGNGINDLFTNAANWSAGGVPAVGESGTVLLQFPANSASLTPLDNIPGLAVDGVSFAGGNYTLGGSGGVTLTLRRAPVGVFSIVCTASNGLADKIASTLPLVIASTTRVQADFRLNLDSAISGSGGLKCDGGDIYLRGAVANTYAFTTTVTAGTLVLAKSAGVNSIGGDLVIDGAFVQSSASNQLGATGSITLRNNGWYTPGAIETLPALHFATGHIWLPGVPGVVLAGDVSVAADTGDNYLDGYLGLGAAVRTIDVAAGASICHDGTLANGSVTSGIKKLGAGMLCMRGDNTFTGNVALDAGYCLVTRPTALGAGNSTTTVSAGASLTIGNSVPNTTLTIANETLNLAGEVFMFTDAIWTGPVVLTGTVSNFDGAFSGVNSEPLRFIHTGVMSGSGQLNKGYGGGLVLQGAAGNTYSGGTVVYGELLLGKTAGVAIPGDLQIDAGTVALTNSNQIASTASVVINGGVLDMGSRTNTIGLLSGTGGEVKFALGTLTTGGAGNSIWSGLLSGNGANSLIKQGAGTLTLNNAANGGDTLTGAILVNQGTLQMDGLHPGPITVGIAGLLSGSGTVGAVSVLGGKVCLCALKTANLVINGGGSQAITVIGIASYGHIKVTGPVNLTQSSLNASLTYVPYAGSTFMLLENDGTDAITGTFSGMPEGASVTLGTQVFTITYHGGTGNDVVLTLVSGGRPPLSIDKFTSSRVPGNPNANAVLIEATGQPGVLHVIESSSDLVFWNVINAIPVLTDAQGHSSTSFFDDNPARRFYRIKEVAL